MVIQYPYFSLAVNLLFASHDRLPLFRPIAHYTSTHSSLATTNLVHYTLTTRYHWHSIQLDNQPMPLRTPQQDHSPTHQPTVIPSTATYLLTLTLAYDDQVEPLPAPDVRGDLLLFLRTGRLALIFTSLLFLPVEGNSNDSTVLGE